MPTFKSGKSDCKGEGGYPSQFSLRAEMKKTAAVRTEVGYQEEQSEPPGNM
jgi:hypothetical protein